MQTSLLAILACPGCRTDLSLNAQSLDASGDVETGTLGCSSCGESYPIVNGIPRFVQSHAADASFGYQWNTFRKEQLDSSNGANLSAQRWFAETQWTPESLRGQRILDVGCGAGRFLEVVSQHQCDVVGVDVTSAVEAAAKTVKGRRNAHIVQADVYRLPFRSGSFDGCYCIGVAQHTPSPLKTLAALPRMLRAGGRLAVTVYERKRWTRLNGKYLLRPLTRRMNKRWLLGTISWTMPVLFPLTEVLFRLPVVGRAFDFAIPVANYVQFRELNWRQRYQIALLDTFDRLAPEFDDPLTDAEVRDVLASECMSDIRRLPNSGVNMVAVRGTPSNV